MSSTSYLHWFLHNTPATWWHDSGDPGELSRALELEAVGVTTNPVLSAVTLTHNRSHWGPMIQEISSRGLPPQDTAEALMGLVVRQAAERVLPHFERTGRRSGYVCAQLNPALAGDREAMTAMARRFNALAPNIAVKLPATAAGMDVLEELVAEGITVTSTVSFTVAQVLAAAERHRRGAGRARAKGLNPGHCFAVIMIGRIDDYLREVAHDRKAAVSEEDIRRAGVAITKRAYALFRAQGYDAKLLVAALRGPYHLTELAGARLVMSIHPKSMKPFLDDDLCREERIGQPVPEAVLDRLRRLPDFVKAYEPEGLAPEDFISFGVTQRTLSQFSEIGWKVLETLTHP